MTVVHELVRCPRCRARGPRELNRLPEEGHSILMCPFCKHTWCEDGRLNPVPPVPVAASMAVIMANPDTLDITAFEIPLFEGKVNMGILDGSWKRLLEDLKAHSNRVRFGVREEGNEIARKLEEFLLAV
jgi:hypothetical protein